MEMMLSSPPITRLALGMLLVMGVALAAVPSAARLSYARQGDIILGGLFSLHFPDCDSIPTIWSLQQAQAMVYAINKINNRSDLLPNLTLGFDIRDSCFANEDLSLWSVISLVQGQNSLQDQRDYQSCGNSSHDLPRSVVGIVGPQTSIVSLTVASIADLYDVPMISFGATSDELSDKERFPYFLRTVPPDRFQAEAMVDLISYMGWEYISIIYRADTYGIRGAHALKRLAERRGLCVALSLPVHSFPTDSQLEQVTAKLFEARKARAVVVFAGLPIAKAVIAAVNAGGMEGHFTWIGSEAWAHDIGRDYDTGEMPPIGAIFFLLRNPELHQFQEYFSSMKRDAIQKNPWFEIFLKVWETIHNCTVWVDERCNIPHRDLYTSLAVMSPVMDAVYAFAYALHSVINNSNSDTVHGRDLLYHLKEVSFDGESGPFQFTTDGAVAGKYLIQNVQEVNGDVKLVTVGLWDALAPREHLTLNSKLFQWNNGSTMVPASTCREVCPYGSRTVPLKEKCCFGCFACEAHAIVFNNTKCMECEETEWPDEKRSSCIPIIPTVIEWTGPMQLLLLILSCMGFVLSTLIVVGLVWYRNHNVVKATSRELSCVNVLGLFLSFVVPFLLIAPPTHITCCLSQAMVSLCFTLAYAPTLLKMCRIYRIFRAGKRSAERLRFISPVEQVTIACLLILIQVICVIVTSARQPGIPQYLFHTPRDNHIESYCGTFGIGFLVSFSYNLVLIVGCCFFAFLARRLPDNYNESKFIGASVYSTLLASLAAIPLYCTSNNALQKVAALSMPVLLNAYLTAACVYIPKLYAIRFLAPPRPSRTTSSSTSP